MGGLVVAAEDPRAPDIRRLLERHLEFSRAVTPEGHVHALGLEGLLAPSITFVAARIDGELMGVGALRHLDPAHGEIKSMHTAWEARRRGVARAVVAHLLDVARAAGHARVSLETGSMAAFAPARALYEECGFERCAPFGDYTDTQYSVCMTRLLEPTT